jgi:hypothetical protein
MSADRFSQTLSETTPGMRMQEAITAERMNALGILAQEAAAGKHVRGGMGIQVRNGPAGVTISTRNRARGAPIADHPWRYRSAPAGSTAFQFCLTSGTVNLIVPTGMAGPFTVGSSSVLYVWVSVTLSGTGAVTGAAMASGSSLPSPVTAWFSATGAPSAIYLPVLKVTSDAAGITMVEQIEKVNRQFGRRVVYMSCTETKFAMMWD